jgi:replicative DNA helicase
MTQKRNLIELFQRKVNLDEHTDNDVFLRELQRFVSEHETYGRPPKPAQDLFQLMEETATQLDAKTTENKAIPTGFQQYDETYGGLLPGELVLIGGRPSMGKTQLLVQLAINASKHVPVLYCSLDVPADLLAQRFVANMADIAGESLLVHAVGTEEKYRIHQAIASMQERSLLIADENNLSIHQLIAYWEKYVVERGIKVMFIDYIQLLGEQKYNRNRHQELSYISQRLKKFAQQHHVALVVTSQLSRAVETRGGSRQPILSDLRESGSLEQDADKVAFIYRPEYYGLTEDEFGPTEDMIHLVLAKNRTGKIETIYLRKTPNFNRIEGLSEATRTFKSGPRFTEFDEEDPF